MAATHPALAEQWHPTKNGDLTPFDVRALTRTKIWWQCVVDPTEPWFGGSLTLIKDESYADAGPFGEEDDPPLQR